MEPLISLENIDKKFSGVHALTDVSIDFYPGEVHALVGENGAGKSTLIKVVLGAHAPTSGTVKFEGKEIALKSPFDASKLGIEGVHQELMLIPWLPVWQNIFMNREITKGKGKVFDKKKMIEISRQLLADFGINIDVTKPVKMYSASVWKMIDIVRVVNLNPRLIIFDEPTAILTKPEVECLFRKIKELRNKGVGIIYISHRLNELNEIGDKLSILRDGHLIGTRNVKDVTTDDIVKMMVGRDVSNYYSRNLQTPGKELVRMEDVDLKKGQKKINLHVRIGEIVGLAGLVGSGRTEVAEGIMGINKIENGKIYLGGEEFHPSSPAKMISRKTYLVPENRKYQGLILRFSVATNIALSVFGRWSKVFYNKRKELETANQMIEALSIKTPSPAQLVRNLSGGNQQKVVIGKAMETESEFIIFDEPSVGVDVGSKEEIHNLMDGFVAKGGGILMISSDLPEVIGMCDRVYIMYEGEIVKELRRDELSDQSIANYMFGSREAN